MSAHPDWMLTALHRATECLAEGRRQLDEVAKVLEHELSRVMCDADIAAMSTPAERKWRVSKPAPVPEGADE